MAPLMPFFTFYGGKQRAAKHYPAPEHDIIVEPFAGAAGYSLRYPERQVILRDLDPWIVRTWSYLLAADEDDILALPDLEPGQSTAELDIPEGARHLIGWWLNKGSARPKLRASTFMADYPVGGPYWGPRVRERIASQLQAVRHWRIQPGSYESSPDLTATWFIDPPYQHAGQHYRYASRQIDYSDLASWCLEREGQLIVCEAEGADWLPFRPLIPMNGMEGRQIPAATRARMEVVYP